MTLLLRTTFQLPKRKQLWSPGNIDPLWAQQTFQVQWKCVSGGGALLKEFSLPDCLQSILLSSCPLSRKWQELLIFLPAPPHSSSTSSGIRFLLLIFLVVLLCGTVLCCLQCWLRRPRIGCPRRTLAVFAVGDLDPVYGKISAHFWTSSLKPYGFVVYWKSNLWKADLWPYKMLFIEGTH